MKWFLLAWVVLAFATSATAEDKKAEGPIKLTLIAKTDKYKLATGTKTAAEYKLELGEMAKKAEKGGPVRPPKPPAVDLVLQLTNTSKEEVTIYVGGDSNVYEFELSGGNVVAMGAPVGLTADFKIPMPVTLAAGKSYEIPVKQLSDGNRGVSRLVYWTEAGDYKLVVKYTLSDKDGGRGTQLKSEPVKITVTGK